MNQEETISAISTAMGNAGIGIVRMSGEKAIDIADKIFFAINRQPLKNISAKTATLGKILDADGKIIDEAICLIMRAPNSYTKEDVVEFQCHGGMTVLQNVLRRTFEEGARPAERGEFTKRAFLNGRIDLSQAQAVMDVIQAKTSVALSAAQNQLAGKTSKKIRDIRSSILEILAHIEALIDFPEDEVDDIFQKEIDEKISAQIKNIQELLDNQAKGKILREGLTTAIIGKPNVGKSSLLNFLSEKDRAIVTDIPGTTRDAIEEIISIEGIPLRLIDTAGIRNSENLVEKIGIEKTRQLIKTAEIIFALFDGSKNLSEEDEEILKLINKDNTIILLTKADLPQILQEGDLKNYSAEKIINFSVKTGAGMTELEKILLKKIGKVDAEMNFIRDEREADIWRRTKRHLEEAKKTLTLNLGIDFISIDLRAALELLSELTGESVTEDIINEIFSKFCIGK